METDVTYSWKRLDLGRYNELDANTPIIEYITIPLVNLEIESSFFKSYQKITIPSNINDLIKGLLIKFNLTDFYSEFIVLCCAIQKLYIDNFEIDYDNLTIDFDNQKKDYEELLKILESYLFSESKKNLHSISFKFDSTPTLPINNFFVVNDVFDAICVGYGITKENFTIRKKEILELTNDFKVQLYGENIKTSFISKLYKFVSPFIEKESDSLRFIGCFLHLSQIPTNSKETEIEIYENINDFLKSIDIKNLRHYLTRPKQFTH